MFAYLPFPLSWVSVACVLTTVPLASSSVSQGVSSRVHSMVYRRNDRLPRSSVTDIWYRVPSDTATADTVIAPVPLTTDLVTRYLALYKELVRVWPFDTLRHDFHARDIRLTFIMKGRRAAFDQSVSYGSLDYVGVVTRSPALAKLFAKYGTSPSQYQSLDVSVRQALTEVGNDLIEDSTTVVGKNCLLFLAHDRALVDSAHVAGVTSVF